MSIEQTEIEVVSRTKKMTVHSVTCDLCGKSDLDAKPDFDDAIRWSTKSIFDRKEITVRFEYGTCYPEGGSLDVEVFDVCPDCWDKKLKPLFQNGPRQYCIDH